MPPRDSANTRAVYIALCDNRRLDLRRPIPALAFASEYLKPLSALAHRIITGDYHRSSVLGPSQAAQTPRWATPAQGGIRTALTRKAVEADAQSARRRWTRMPGPSSGVPMNSMPAASRAAWILLKVDAVDCGMPSIASILLTVFVATPARVASDSALSSRALLAARICIPVSIDAPINVH